MQPQQQKTRNRVAEHIGIYIRIIETALTYQQRPISRIVQTSNSHHTFIVDLQNAGFIKVAPKQLTTHRYSRTRKTVTVTPEGVAWLHAAKQVCKPFTEANPRCIVTAQTPNLTQKASA